MSAYKKQIDDEVFQNIVEASTPDDTDYDYVPDTETPVDAALEMEYEINDVRVIF